MQPSGVRTRVRLRDRRSGAGDRPRHAFLGLMILQFCIRDNAFYGQRGTLRWEWTGGRGGTAGAGGGIAMAHRVLRRRRTGYRVHVYVYKLNEASKTWFWGKV